jgi:hypothetical protein
VGGGYELRGVSCSSTTACTSVGSAWATLNYQPPRVPLVERWDGTGWSVQSTPQPGGDTELSGVSCRTTFCVAVGSTASQRTDPFRQPLAMSWDGAAWTVQSVPIPAGAEGADLVAVSCTSASSCVAVGNSTKDPTSSLTQAFIAAWNGSTWTLPSFSTPSTSISSALGDVSCGDVNSCSAVGVWTNNPNRVAPLAETWNGTSWHLDGVANPLSAQTYLGGASCASRTTCTAVGGHSTLSGTYTGLAERRVGGGWNAQSPPNVPSASSNTLLDVGCVSASNCVAVGFAQGRTIASQAYAVVWNGFGWKIEYPPTPMRYDQVSGISCPAPAFCMTVGSTFGLVPTRGDSAIRTS